jgi:glycosyltransferase involved in cell wall biosynthesis
MDRALTRMADITTCVSRRGAKYYDAVWIPNAIEPTDFPSKKVRIKDIQIAIVGRLSKEKGLATIEKLPIAIKEKIVFIRERPWIEAVKILAGSDLLLLPSIFEGCPTVMLEAMYLKVPVIARRMPETEDIGEDSAYYFDRDEELASIIQYVLENPKESKKKANDAYKRVLEEFTWDRVIERYIKIYKA